MVHANRVVVDRSWSDTNSKKPVAFQRIAERALLPAAKSDICLRVPHQHVIVPLEDGVFYINFWSSCGGNAGFRPPNKIWGIDVDCRDSGFKGVGEGEIFKDDTTNWNVAELVGNNLYIHHDLCHEGSDSEQKIFGILLKKVAEFLSLSANEREALNNERQRKLKEQSRDAYGKALFLIKGTRSSASLKEAEETQRHNVRHCSRELTQALQAWNSIKRQMNDNGAKNDDGEEKYRQEFDKLSSAPKIRDVLVNGDMISVWTDVLYCRNKATGLLHEIGAFRFDINPESASFCWHNLTRKVDAFEDASEHPHIFKPDEFCLGSAEEIIPELIASGEIRSLVSVMIQFIESCNSEDEAGKTVFMWPLAPKAMQSAETKAKLQELAPLFRGNPFRDLENGLDGFIKQAKKLKKGSEINYEDNEYYFSSDDAQGEECEFKTTDRKLEKLFKVSEDWVPVIIGNYFKLKLN